MDESNETKEANPPRPLDGLKVLELGHILAGPFASALLGYYGAEVIKIEPPGSGDPIRRWRVMDGDTSCWWHSLARNKKSVTVDLRQNEGRALVRRLALQSDVLIENFKPGTLERWGLAPDELRRENPGLICARISGYGQTGPLSHLPGFASVCESFGGLRHVTGMPGEPPVRANLSLGDSLTGLHAAFGVLLALIQRQKVASDKASDKASDHASGGGSEQKEVRGQDVDLGIFEAVFNMMEASVPEYDRRGVVREASGTTVTGIVPTNTYRCRDGRFVVIGGSGDPIFRRLMRVAGRPDLAEDPRLQTNDGRVEHEREIDAVLADWCAALDADEVIDTLRAESVAAGPIYSVADMFEDPQYAARGLLEEHEVDGGTVKVPAMIPKLSATPDRTDWTGPKLGAHNDEILRGRLGLSDDDLAGLRERGVISGVISEP